MADKFEIYTESLDGPATGIASVTPHDTNDLAQASRAIYVGGAGDVAVEMVDGSSATLVGVTAGFLLPIRVNKVLATGTTATNIVSLS
jgi:hypothetical protein